MDQLYHPVIFPIRKYQSTSILSNFLNRDPLKCLHFCFQCLEINESVEFELLQNSIVYMDTVFFVQTGDKRDFFYVLTDMVDLGLSSISDAEEAKTIVYYLNLTLLLFSSSLSNYWPMTSSWVTGHKCASPVLSYSQHHHQLILFLATCVINSQSRGADMWCGHVGWKKK